ncbi:hypothetical protein C6496_10480 [Candidatus Poribacteria bacterium]|nr:MAG: hypothetical protein C6496_10480 [Candidatus Poribacteria bacterium]
MANHFNELLLQTLKEVGVRLERLEGRVDHVINEKADKIDVKSALEKLDRKSDKEDVQDVKADVQDLKADIKDIKAILDQKADKADVNILRDEVRAHGQRLDRIETGIRTLQWTMTAGLAVLGIILAFVRSC